MGRLSKYHRGVYLDNTLFLHYVFLGFSQDSNLALHSEGIKMTVASELPHFLAVDDGALGTGVVIYRLQVFRICSMKQYM